MSAKLRVCIKQGNPDTEKLQDFRDTAVNLVRTTTARAGIAYFVP